MSYIEDKISCYVEMEYLLEFDTPEDCMKYFNTYDCQNFKTVEEMKKYQDKYGFGYNGKWYHINVEEALDILDNLGIKPQFTDNELQLIYAALMAYGNKLSNMAKEIPNEIEVVDKMTDRAKDSWMLARRIIK